MALFDEWKKIAYNENQPSQALQAFWDDYFKKEKSVYEILLADPDKVVEGSVRELADQFGITVLEMTGFLDGINESLLTPNPVETIEEDSRVSLAFDKERLYKNMVDARADWLYELPQWDKIFSAEKKKELYREQKQSTTVVKPKKIGRNDPCPCGSGKKYKFCHGRKGAEPLPGYEQA